MLAGPLIGVSLLSGIVSIGKPVSVGGLNGG